MQNGMEFNIPEDLQKFLIDCEYKRPSLFYLFDKTFLIDLDALVERMGIEYPELKMQKTEVEEYIENGFFPELYLEDGKRGFMLHSTLKIDFIKKIIDKWGYNKHEIKEITEYEDYIIDEILTSDELDYSDLPSLPFFIKYIKNMINENKVILRSKQSSSVKVRIKKQNEKYRKYLNFFQDKEFKDLPLEMQKEINNAVFEINQRLEMSRLMMVADIRAERLLGFSPQVHIGMKKSATLDYDGDDDSQFPYTCDYFDRKWFYGKWECDPRWIGPNDVFFATPEFYIGYSDDNSINISIRDTQKVDARYMREIEKYYNSFRKYLNIPKKKWGEKSGRKEMFAKRNRLLKEAFKKFKEQTPNIATEKIIEKSIDRIGREYNKISPERAQKIIYSKKKK